LSAFLPLTPGRATAHHWPMRTDILIYAGFDELDAFGPYEVLARAGFDVALVADGGPDRIVASQGAIVVPHGPPRDGVELLVVPGGSWTQRRPEGAWAEVQRGVLPPLIAARHAAGVRIATVCTGAFLAAGLLQGRPAITHHDDVDDLEAMGVRVIRDARVVDDGDIVSAAGVTSGIDLALWVVEQARGRAAADAIAAMIEHPRDGRVYAARAANAVR
jgi:transcriptional regulator GlxA family with amidase domain